ncbi:hypothetical protein RJ640_019286 [Escallonia rubra]|uniref:TIR domain-containing protein n=1 Tax=Escallonia rubra TaxID=112253 RepID=A0AA88UTE2_9ASTE|nr:hypothetical protein RJ640_019286 [Escallonia rubra]
MWTTVRRSNPRPLAHILIGVGFCTFRDNEEIARGEEIELEIKKAMPRSRSSVVVFSENYASSKWCLDELVMIMECRRTSNHVVIAVFYHVDPSDVRHQKESFKKALDRHEQRFKAGKMVIKKDWKEWIKGWSFGTAFARHEESFMAGKMGFEEWMERMEGWREALKEAAWLGAMVWRTKLKIVKVIEGKLPRTHLSIPQFLVGIDYQVESITLWLQNGSSDVGIMSIWGSGGVGKTTIAKRVFNLNVGSFDTGSFLSDIARTFKEPHGILPFQKQLVSEILVGKKRKIHSVDEGIQTIQKAMSGKRVLVVLDDVEEDDQVDAILGMQNWFCPDSKIIITTRNQQFIKAHRADKIHMVKVDTLPLTPSFELFCWHAFGKEDPSEIYTDLTNRVVACCGGVPLALRVLGLSLSYKSVDVWGSTLEILESIPDVLHEYGFSPISGIENLKDRGLFSVDSINKLRMHQLLQHMGREIIRQKAPDEPGKRCRLWRHEDSLNVLKEITGTQATKGLALDMHMQGELQNQHTSGNTFGNWNEVQLKTSAFTRMRELRLLLINYVQLKGSYKWFPKKLRWLCWHGFPLESILIDFSMESLVVIDMRNSNLTRFWDGTQVLRFLKILNLSRSPYLIRTPDFSRLPNLERLILKDCTGLVEVHESIGDLQSSLVLLNLKGCKSLRKLPSTIGRLKFLETLIISGCASLDRLPEEISMMEFLSVFLCDGISLGLLIATPKEETTSQLSWVTFSCCIGKISLVGCQLTDAALSRIELCKLPALQELDLSENPISFISIKGLKGLIALDLMNCTRLRKVETLPGSERISVGGPIKEYDIFSFGCEQPVKITDNFKLEPLENVDAEMANYLQLDGLQSCTDREVMLFSISTFGERKGPIQGPALYNVECDMFSSASAPNLSRCGLPFLRSSAHLRAILAKLNSFSTGQSGKDPEVAEAKAAYEAVLYLHLKLVFGISNRKAVEQVFGYSHSNKTPALTNTSQDRVSD